MAKRKKIDHKKLIKMVKDGKDQIVENGCG
jgi:hypothetical protein